MQEHLHFGQKMKKCLIISDIFFNTPSVVGGYEIIKIGFLKKTNFIEKYKRAFYIRTNNKKQVKYFTIDETVKMLPDVDVVVLFDGTRNYVLSEYAKKIEENVDLNKTRLIFYFWNTVRSLDDLCLSKNWEVNTYDRHDAEKYSFRYVGGFYNDITSDGACCNIVSDIFFVGKDKGRFEFIRSLESKLKKMNLNPDFLYVDPVKCLYDSKYDPPLSYGKIIKRCLTSKAILDVVQAKQFGLTLRVYEGIFMNKKIVTTHKHIKEYKQLYNSHNVLQIDSTTSPDKIMEFINSEIVPYSNELKNMYSFESWLLRLIDLKSFFNDTIYG